MFHVPGTVDVDGAGNLRTTNMQMLLRESPTLPRVLLGEADDRTWSLHRASISPPGTTRRVGGLFEVPHTRSLLL